MSTSNKFLSDYVYLAEASYADFSKGYDTSSIKLAISGKKEQGGVGKPEQFADLVIKNYTIKAHWEDRTDESSFSGTLFKGTGKDGGNGDYVLALKGTKEVVDDLIITDGGEIVLKGLAYNQIVDMYNFWNQINAKKGQTYNAAKVEHFNLEHNLADNIDANITEFLTNNPSPKGVELSAKVRAVINDFLSELENDQAYLLTNEQKLAMKNDLSMLVDGLVVKVLAWHTTPQLQSKSLSEHIKASFVDTHQAEYITTADSATIYNDERQYGLGIENIGKVTVTGHSLGGHLSAAFSRLFADSTEHAYLVNGAGFNEMFNWRINKVFSILGGENNFSSESITNITGDKNIEMVAQDWLVLQQQGSQPELFIESGTSSVLGHGSDQMSDSMAVIDLFMTQLSHLV